MNLTVRAVWALVWGTLGILLAAAPVLQAHAHPAAAAIYVPFSFFCHQNPERSFHLMQYPLAVCHRCCGIYGGLLLGALCAISYHTRPAGNRRRILLAAALPLLLDAVLPWTGLWPGFWWSRLGTGIWLGFLVAPLPVRGLEELLQALVRRMCAAPSTPFKGEVA